ncbi:MAG TPA: HEAT repeat domain-containing protein [Nitrosopumilaceae archaeon]|nr:HEAT repeat domain-containing protein [Nitrosopumilaceae archaeon]
MGQEFEILEFGTSEDKIKILEILEFTDDFKIIKKMISCLDDSDIKVRGEAFSSLILNKNKIGNVLIKSLNDPSKNIRGFVALVLANRNDTSAISVIIDLVNDESSVVRSCALGALGHLGAKEAKKIVHNCILDSNLEVRKSALQALIDLEGEISENEILEISKEKDRELEQLIIKLKKSGPEGI